jgi:hypothetical protein
VIGLLPEPAEVESFVNDTSPDAYAKVVDRLLASPHYGERWARHWLDVARYADSWGHIHDDDNPNAWRYRDYVIQAFNQDKPYDQFILEQVAGDELDHVTYDSLIATSFHRIGPRVHFREKQNPQYRYDYLDDMLSTTAKGFLALTVNCARCHDHKFDPITRQDYYRMLASFFPTVDYDWPLAAPGEIAKYKAVKAEVDAQTKPLKSEVRKIEAPYRKAIFEAKLSTFPEDIQTAVHTPEEQRTPGQKLLAAQVMTIATAGRRDLHLFRCRSRPGAPTRRPHQGTRAPLAASVAGRCRRPGRRLSVHARRSGRRTCTRHHREPDQGGFQRLVCAGARREVHAATFVLSGSRCFRAESRGAARVSERGGRWPRTNRGPAGG